MQLSPHRYIGRILLLPLLFFVTVWGIIPAFTGISTDFPNYYTAARLVVEGGDIARLYDDAWFQEQISQHGIDQAGKFSPFPPTTALVLVPLAFLGPQAALSAVTVLNLLFIVVSGYCLSRIVTMNWSDSALLLLLAGIGLCNCLRFGQLYIAVSTSMLVAYYFHLQGRWMAGGLAAGLFIPIKYFPVVLLFYFLLRRDGRILAVAFLTMLLELGVSILLLGWQIHQEFLHSILGLHLTGHFGAQDRYSSTFQSWNSLLLRLFVTDPVRNPQPALPSNVFYNMLILGVTAGSVLVTIAAAVRLRTQKSIETPLVLALGAFCALTIAPGTATYHFVLLWLPVTIVLEAAQRHGKRGIFFATLAFYGMIGFIPYRVFRELGASGFMVLLGYPRLLLTTLLFLLALVLAWQIGKPPNSVPHPAAP